MTGQFVGAAETLGAAGELAGMRSLARVRADVPSLVFQTVKGAITERALVRARQIMSSLLGGGTGAFEQRR